MFATEVTVAGPYRQPAQMLADQDIGGHSSVHDEATAASLDLSGAPIEGPTHFSQFDPLAFVLWGPAWFERGCISSHFRTMVVEGESVQATMTRLAPAAARIEAHKEDGAQVLAGTASVGPEHPETELEARRSRQAALAPSDLVILDQLELGARSDAVEVSIPVDEPNGPLYPFSLADKLERITEPHPWYTPEGGASSPWGQAIVPVEMISVLAHKAPPRWPVRQPALGLFLDLQVRFAEGPVFVDRSYRVEHELVGLGQSRRTESYWTHSSLTDTETGRVAAEVLLHSGVFKESYPEYPPDRLG